MLADNPILRRERIRFSRKWLLWTILIVLVWASLTWVTRRVFPRATLGMSFWQVAVLDTMNMLLRADLVIAFFMVYRSASETKWHQLREEFAVRFLTPSMIVIGKAAVPLMVLMSLNILGWWISYGQILRDPTYYTVVTIPFLPPERESPVAVSGPSSEPQQVAVEFFLDSNIDDSTTTTTQSVTVVQPKPAQQINGRQLVVSGALPVAVLGLLEDFLYSTLVILIAMSVYLFRRDAFHATFAGLGRLFVAGVAIVFAGWAWTLVSLFLPDRFLFRFALNPALDLIIANAVWFGIVLPLELFLIRRYYRLLKRDTGDWLVCEDNC